MNKKVNEEESIVSTKDCPTLKSKQTAPEAKTSMTNENTKQYRRIIARKEKWENQTAAVD